MNEDVCALRWTGDHSRVSVGYGDRHHETLATPLRKKVATIIDGWMESSEDSVHLLPAAERRKRRDV